MFPYKPEYSIDLIYIFRIKESLENAENQESTEEPKKEDWNEDETAKASK
jgi:hypothetical protein